MILTGWTRCALLATVLAVASEREGPFEIPLFNTPKAPSAQGHARLVFADSPFGVATTADGHASYDVQIDASGLPDPAAFGARGYVAWAATTDLTEWSRLGTVNNGKNTVGHVEFNKFLLVITAEATPASAVSHAGPTVLHGTSPSGWLQSFLSHPLFRGIPP